MNIQIIGTKKNSDTRKAERYFRERNISYQFVDLAQRGLAPGELENIARAVDPADLIDPESKEYASRGMKYLDFDPVEEILENPSLLRMPIVRNGRSVTVGYDVPSWQAWLDEGK